MIWKKINLIQGITIASDRFFGLVFISTRLWNWQKFHLQQVVRFVTREI